MKTLPLPELIQHIYPDLYAVHTLDEEVGYFLLLYLKIWHKFKVVSDSFENFKSLE